MLKLAASSLAAGLAVLLLIGVSGHLVWDNKLLWVPLGLFGFATMLGFGGTDHEDRAPLLVLGAASFCCILGYAVLYVFLFGLVGR